jgi:hypothetical protein
MWVSSLSLLLTLGLLSLALNLTHPHGRFPKSLFLYRVRMLPPAHGVLYDPGFAVSRAFNSCAVSRFNGH